MPQRSDMLPQGLAGIWQAIKDLRRDLQEVRAARRLEAASIGSGGLQVLDGGYFRVYDTDGSQQFLVGGISPPHTDGSPQRGMLVYREDATLALALYTGGPERQGLRIYDGLGNTIFSEDVVVSGLSRPYIPYPVPADEDISRWPRTSSGSWTTIGRSRAITQHPRIALHCVPSWDSGVSGQLRFLVNGTVIATGATNSTLTGTYSLPSFSHMAEVELQLQAQVTGGAGNFYGLTRYAYGVQS